ncbi:hypothetical protein KW797_00835 [Candidatus Parcubacteria bacterium]|nr:hypothetical protein [Candidatus Parcubacteria bacterium]
MRRIVVLVIATAFAAIASAGIPPPTVAKPPGYYYASSNSGTTFGDLGQAPPGTLAFAQRAKLGIIGAGSNTFGFIGKAAAPPGGALEQNASTTLGVDVYSLIALGIANAGPPKEVGSSPGATVGMHRF